MPTMTKLQKHIAGQVRAMLMDAAAAGLPGARQDAELTAFVPRELEAIIAGAYRKLYPDLMGRSLVPPQDGIPAFAETVKYNIYDRFGVAKLISAYGDDLPRADIVKDEVRSPIRSFGDAYGYNVDELLASEAGQLPLDAEKANAARMAYEEKIDRIIANGDSAAKLVGLLNIANALSYTVPNDGTGSTKTWSTKTPDQILRDLHGLYQFMRDQTNGVHTMRRIVLPLTQYGLIATTARSSTSDTTILQYFLANHPGVEVLPWYKLKAAGAAATDRMLGYIPDSQYISFVENQPYTQYPPQARNLELVVPCKGKSGGVICKYPFTVAYGDGI
jgi:hypothetical protein